MSLYINHYPPGEKKKKNLWTKVDSNKNIWLWHQYFDCSLATQQYISSKAYGLLKHGVFYKSCSRTHEIVSCGTSQKHNKKAVGYSRTIMLLLRQ